MGVDVGEQQLGSGPTGFLDKGCIKDAKQNMEKLNIICEGTDTSRCTFPAGYYSCNKPLCIGGYEYSYLKKQCYLIEYKASENQCPTTCSSVTGSCGTGWTAHSHGNCFMDCHNDCIVTQTPDPANGIEHMVCDLKNEWVSLASYDKEGSTDNFNFNSGTGAGN